MRPLASVTSRTGGACGVRTCRTEWVDREPRGDSKTGHFRLRANARRAGPAVSASAPELVPVVVAQQRYQHTRKLLKGSQVTGPIRFYDSPGQNRTFVPVSASDAPGRCNNRELTALSCGRTFLASAVIATLAARDSGARKTARRRRGSADYRRLVH